MHPNVYDLMLEQVFTVQPHYTVDHVRRLIDTNPIHAIPVVNSDNEVVGIVSTADLVPDLKGGAPVSQIMTRNVYTVSQSDDVQLAARVMRNHRIHHLVVTYEDRIVGILSSFDLLRLVEEGHFTT